MRYYLIVIVVFILSACDKTAPQPTKETLQATEKIASNAESYYLDMVEQYFNDYLKLNPVTATFIGVNDYNDKFTNNLTDSYLKQRHQLNKKYLSQAKQIDRDKLSPELKLSYDVFIYDRNQALIAETYPMRFLPLNQFYSPILTMAQLGSGDSAQPFNNKTDYENWLKRINGFIEWMNTAEHRMDQGIESNVVLPAVLVEHVIAQLNSQQVDDPSDSIFYSPINKFPENLSETDKNYLTANYRQMLTERLLPAFKQLSLYLQTKYLPASRATDGWWALPNGKQWYQQIANQHTTSVLDVDEIHEIGLSEVARITHEMDEARKKIGFEGSLTEFFHSLSTDPVYFYKEKQDLIDGYVALKSKINPVLADYFDIKPSADYIVKAVESFREKSAAGASYNPPSADGSRAGIFYINTYNLNAQPKWGMTTLSLHEAAPGHHFQISINQSLTNIPQFQRFSNYTAFVEGWALYAEYLGVEMGLFTDPYQYFGKLSDEMLRAMRLVVDTGLHAKGWSREQAIAYMKANSAMAESDIIAEVERYMAIPGQALSYKIGQLKILELRKSAEMQLGDAFNLKAFHNQLLTSGSLPLSVLESKINLWIKQQLIAA